MTLEVREREGGRLRCPYCHDLLVADETPARCGACEAVHHATCAAELGGCASCAAELNVAELPLSDRRCSFFHDCGTNAVQGDSLCHDHRRRVNASAPRFDPARRLAGLHAEALALSETLHTIGRAVGVASLLVVLPLAIVLGASLGLSRLPGSLLAVAALVGANAVGGWFKIRAKRLRHYLEASAPPPAPRTDDARVDPKAGDPAA